MNNKKFRERKKQINFYLKETLLGKKTQSKKCSDNLQNRIFIILAGLRKRFMGHVFDVLMLFCCFNCTVFKNGSKTNQ